MLAKRARTLYHQSVPSHPGTKHPRDATRLRSDRSPRCSAMASWDSMGLVSSRGDMRIHCTDRMGADQRHAAQKQAHFLNAPLVTLWIMAGEGTPKRCI